MKCEKIQKYLEKYFSFLALSKDRDLITTRAKFEKKNTFF